MLQAAEGRSASSAARPAKADGGEQAGREGGARRQARGGRGGQEGREAGEEREGEEVGGRGEVGARQGQEAVTTPGEP